MSDLIVIAYDTKQKGFEGLATVDRLQKLQLINVVDAAVAVKDQSGKVKIKQTLEHNNTGTAAAWGGFWGLLVGVLFLTPIFGAVVGLLLGALVGRRQDLGIDNEFIKEVGDSLDPGNSALLLLVYEANAEKVMPEMRKLGGTLFYASLSSLSSDAEEQLRQALEHDTVRVAAEQSLELE